MKKIIAIILLAATLVSCSKSEFEEYGGEEFLQIDDAPGSVGEDSGLFTVTLGLASGSNPNGVTINYSITSEDPSRFSVSPSESSITIPAGEFTADIEINPIDNFDIDGDVDITIELLDTSDLPIGIAGQGLEKKTAIVTIVDNDCPFDTEAFIGTYEVDEVFTSGRNQGLRLGPAFGQAYQVEISPLPGDLTGTQFVINNSAGFNQFFVGGTQLNFFSCPGEVLIDQNNIALFANLTIESSSYDEENSQITLAGPLGDFGPYRIILTRL